MTGLWITIGVVAVCAAGLGLIVWLAPRGERVRAEHAEEDRDAAKLGAKKYQRVLQRWNRFVDQYVRDHESNP